MDADLINKYITKSAELNKKSLDNLKELLNKFPYFQTAHLLYIFNAKNINDENLNEIIGKSSAFISNREVLYNLLSGNVKSSNTDKKTDPKKTVLRENTKVTIKSVGKSFDSKKNNIKSVSSTEKEAVELKNTKTENKEVPQKDISKTLSENKEEQLTELGLKKHEVLLDEIFKPKIKQELGPDKIVSNMAHLSESDAIAIPKKDKNKKKDAIKTKSKDSLTDDIFNKIADIKKDKIKVKSADDIFKKRELKEPEKKINKTEIAVDKPEVKERKSIADDKVKEKLIEVKKEVKEISIEKTKKKQTEQTNKENTQMTAADLIQMHKKKPAERKTRKDRSTKRPTFKKEENEVEKVEKAIKKEEPVGKKSTSKDPYSIIKEFSGKKTDIKETEKKIDKPKEKTKQNITQEATKTTQDTSKKTAAENIYDRISQFKKKREEDKEENPEKNKDLIEKFIENEPRIDRNKSQEIEGDVSNESTIEKEPIITELMANIYINQNHFDKAIDIFKKLILKYPKKKDYFAAKIEETENMK